MTNLARLILTRNGKSCEWCGVALFLALIALGLGGAHLWGHA